MDSIIIVHNRAPAYCKTRLATVYNSEIRTLLGPSFFCLKYSDWLKKLGKNCHRGSRECIFKQKNLNKKTRSFYMLRFFEYACAYRYIPT